MLRCRIILYVCFFRMSLSALPTPTAKVRIAMQLFRDHIVCQWFRESLRKLPTPNGQEVLDPVVKSRKRPSPACIIRVRAVSSFLTYPSLPSGGWGNRSFSSCLLISDILRVSRARAHEWGPSVLLNVIRLFCGQRWMATGEDGVATELAFKMQATLYVV